MLVGLKHLKLTLGKCKAKSLTKVLQFGRCLERVEVVIEDGENGRACAEEIEKALIIRKKEEEEEEGEVRSGRRLLTGPHNTAVFPEKEQKWVVVGDIAAPDSAVEVPADSALQEHTSADTTTVSDSADRVDLKEHTIVDALDMEEHIKAFPLD